MATRPRFSGVHLWLVFAGGTIGTAARLVVLLVEDPSIQWLSIPLINIVGSFLLGVVTGMAERQADPARATRMRTFWGVGVMGGFTTYSSFAVLAVDPASLPLAVVTVLAGLAAAVAGLWIARPRPTSAHGHSA
ncbi:fluoride efflux transporter FluC [Microbacterium sp. UBA837]|uniref:fluoride efflux transporter FluC n=1 Tax=Microbacterium sp. UBA837 TaxID=1946956 RepID=UPI0025DC398D|nr:CrcB family protein [Microbacterium sp. UBA837]